MTRSSTKKLFKPLENPEREFRSSWKLFKTPSLDESSSPEFDLFFDLEEHFDEEVAGTMMKTMEEYMCKTQELRDNTFSGSDNEDANEYIENVLEIVDLFHIPNITQDRIMLRAFHMSLTGVASRWLRNKPSGSITTWEDLKMKCLNKYCPPAQTAKKIEEINNFQQEPDKTLYQAWKRFKELLMKCPQHYLTDMQEVILFYNGLEVLTRQILDSKGAIPTKTAVDAKVAIQEIAEYSQKWHNGTSKTRSTATSNGLATIKHNLIILEKKSRRLMKRYMLLRGHYRAAASGFYQRNNANPSYQKRRQLMEESLSKFMNESTKRHEENSNMIKEIRASTDVAIRFQGASIKALEIKIGQMSKVLQERGSESLPSSTKTNPIDQLNSILTSVETNKTSIRRTSVSVMPLSTYLNKGLGELAHTKLTVELADRTVKHPKGIAKNVLVGIGKFVFLVDSIILDMPEDINVPLILERSFFSTAHAKIDVFKRKITLRDYIELKDLNEPLELKRDRFDDLEPIIKEGEVVNEPMMDIFKTRYNFIGGLNDYPSNCDFDRRIHIDCAYNVKFSCMMGFEYVHANFLPILPINVMSKKFCNSIMKDKIEFKWRNELGNFINALVFIQNFYVITNFTVVEDMDPYLDEGIGDVIVEKPFCKTSCVEAKRFDRIITIRDGDDSVTYQMVRSNLRFKHLTNEKCNKIPPLLKVSEQDKINEISQAYQKLKGFYKGVLNLGPEFIRDTKVE
nr:hypothetical protein [Tanacetum cinerariifolium]